MNAHASLVLLEMGWNVKVILQKFMYTCFHITFTGFYHIYIDEDECEFEELNECHEKAICNNTFGSYDCICITGYTGNGTHCTGTPSCT